MELDATEGGTSADAASTLGGTLGSVAVTVGGAKGSRIGTGASAGDGGGGELAAPTVGTGRSSEGIDRAGSADGDGFGVVLFAAAAAASKGFTFLAPKAGFLMISSVFSFGVAVIEGGTSSVFSSALVSCDVDGFCDGWLGPACG